MHIQWGTYFVLILALVGCAPEHSLHGDPLSISDQKEFQHVLTQQIKKETYDFVLTKKAETQEHKFVGRQMKDDWFLKHEKQENFLIEKKGKAITMIHKGKKEVMTAQQFGVIAPRDHLLLVREIGGETVTLPNTSIQGKEANHIKITMNQKKLTTKLKERLISPGIDSTRFLLDKYKVVYHFYFEPKSDRLLMLKTIINFNSEENDKSSHLNKGVTKGNTREKDTELTYLFL